MHTDTIRMVGLRKSPNEPLGLTVEQEADHGQLVVARILGGGMIDRQGLLRIGDVILEVNGNPVSTPEDLLAEISRSHDTVTLKVGPRAVHAAATEFGGKKLTCYMRALFDYDPQTDTLLPCREIGLAFKSGDVLQIVDQRDPNWWQARLATGGPDSPVGLVPSLELEERRKAFVAPEADYVHKISICGARISKKKRRFLYQSKSNNDFDKAELLLYEEVTRMPPFKRKTLVLIGPHGVGRRTLKNRLVNSDPEKFGTIVPYTSRPQRVLEENGQGYWFVDRESMEAEIREHRYLEYGEHNGHLYGTHLDTVRDVIRRGKMCVLDCSPAALKILHNSPEFLPYVIFIAAPGMDLLKTMYGGPAGSSSRNLQFDRQSSIRYSSRRARTLESLASLYEEDDLRKTVEESARLQRAYDKYTDLVIINEDFDVTFRKVVEAMDHLAQEHQWVPVNWIY
ncbi:varicose [Carabus blaptoides fortunei]